MKKVFALLLCSSFATLSFAAEQVWKQVFADAIPPSKIQVIHPLKYAVYSLDEAALKATMFNLAEDPSKGIVITLPAPDGHLKEFKVWQAPMMEPGLAAKFPEIKTFTAVAVDDKYVTAKLDFTDFGFHAMVFDKYDTWFIDPFSKPSSGFYLCYNKKDIVRSSDHPCLVGDDPLKQVTGKQPLYLTQNGLPGEQLKINGSTKRTYRLALACTGEYAVAVAAPAPASLSLTLSAMTTTMNRVNGVYEKELGVHMNLIANNYLLMYMDPSTDPFSGNNSGSLLRFENETNTDTVTGIGPSAYDIGHIFSTGGGGIAELASVCEDGAKAEGVSGQPDPTGDAFDIDFVAHEMGHQFGATHTFNANIGSCTGTGIAMTAFEPGSGSTIMAYAGICGPGDNLQPHSDDYFHAGSLNQVFDFITDVTQGGSCGVAAASGNSPATVPSFSSSYNIPVLTPFELVAPSAIDGDHDALTYDWEEYDLGDFKASFNDIRNFGPILRSFKAAESPIRIFPTLEKLLHGTTNYIGEKLPEVTRQLKFKLTVRDVLNGYGIVNIPDDSILLHVTSAAGPFGVSSPGLVTDYWQAGSTATVTWNVANTDKPPVSCSNVDIMLSVDGGYTFPYTLAGNTANDGSETINVPANIYSAGCRVKVKGSGNVFFAISFDNFSIFPWPAKIDNKVENPVAKIFPVPAKDELHIDLKTPGDYYIVVTDVLGREMFDAKASQQNTIPLSNWAKGVYYVMLQDIANNSRTTEKIVVQ